MKALVLSLLIFYFLLLFLHVCVVCLSDCTHVCTHMCVCACMHAHMCLSVQPAWMYVNHAYTWVPQRPEDVKPLELEFQMVIVILYVLGFKPRSYEALREQAVFLTTEPFLYRFFHSLCVCVCVLQSESTTNEWVSSICLRCSPGWP